MHQVAPDLDGKVGANRAGGSFMRAGGPDSLTHRGYGIGPLDHHRHDRRAGDVLDQPGKEGFALVHGIVAARKLVRHLHHLHADDLQAATLKAPDDITDQAALHAVGLDHHKSAFHCLIAPN